MTTATKIITATHIRHHATPELAFALHACDIGEARLDDGRTVYMTWGRNLTREEAEWFAAKTFFEPVEVGSVCHAGHKRENFELILPTDKVAAMPVIMDMSAPRKWMKVIR